MSYTCPKLCKECPFSNTSTKGWLAIYTVDDMIGTLGIMSRELPFVCHMMMDGNMTWEDAEKAVLDGSIKLCRGYVESMIKSCQSPRHSKLLIAAMAEIKAKGLSDNSMAKWDFKKHHERKQ